MSYFWTSTFWTWKPYLQFALGAKKEIKNSLFYILLNSGIFSKRDKGIVFGILKNRKDLQRFLWLLYTLAGSSFLIRVFRIAFQFACNAFNTSYLTDSCISFTLKLESRQNFCFTSLIRSSTYGKKNISDFPPCGKMVVFVTEFVIFLKTSK